jgi:hypothetical protein
MSLPGGTRSTTLGRLRRGGFGGGSLVGGDLTNQRMHGGRVGGHQLWNDMDTGPSQQCLGVPAPLGQHHRDHVTRISGPRRAPGTMEIGLVLAGRIDVDDQLDLVDVHATCGDIGCHQNPGLARSERGEIAIVRWLRQVAVQVN